jgi:uncharacterized protein (TIGR03118 family)
MAKTDGLAISLLLVLASPALAQFYLQRNLVSDMATPPGGASTIIDPLLINPWGLTASSTSFLWSANQGTGTATLYKVDGMTGAVSKVGLTVAIPGSLIGAPNGPTGQVFNGGSDFVVSSGTASGAALFIFSALNGTISGWSPGVPPPAPSTTAILAATGTPPPTIYTGLALAHRDGADFLYAANGPGGRIDVFDGNFGKTSVPGGFMDSTLPSGDAPFNVTNIGGELWVTYSGPVGAVNVFDTDGHWLRRFATGGTLANPWGVTIAPADFGKFSNALLIGNFNHSPGGFNGVGNISAFAQDGTFLGLVEDTNKNPVAIDGLWTLRFGNGANGGVTNVLYFSAGIGTSPGVGIETHGLLGSFTTCGPIISPVSASPDVLWPPNHKFVDVTISYTVSDVCDANAGATISVSSNEGDVDAESQVIDAHHVNLAAERDGKGSGRVYTITVTATDKLGLTVAATTTVTVPHNQ